MKKILIFVFAFVLTFLSYTKVSAATDVWPQFLHDLNLSANSLDTTLSNTNVSTLKPIWTLKTGGVVAASPTIVNNTVYVGSWDGYEYSINATTGAVNWKTFLGKTTANCNPTNPGVSSAANVQNGVLYVGGGDSNWYALDANTGTVLWSVPTGDNSATVGHYNWASPIINNGFAYIGIASLGDCPLVQGQLLKVNLTTHLIENTLNMVPNGDVGGGIWTTPSLDTSTNTIYVTTGTENKVTQLYAQALVAIDANTLAIKDSWKLPESVAVTDSDFGNSPILFTDSNNDKLVGAVNKNGVLYVFNRSNLAAGPVWQQSIAVGGDCAVCGQGTVSSGTFMNNVFFAGGMTDIAGHGYMGSLRAISPLNGNYVWQHPANETVIAAIASANNVIFDGAGGVFEALDATTGHSLYTYNTGGVVYAAPSVANGTVFFGNTFGNVYAFGLSTPMTPPADPNCPSGWTCQDIGAPAPAGSETVTNGVWNTNAGGTGVGGAGDSFRLITQNTNGDSQVIANVNSLQAVSATSQAGVMIRQSNDANSPYYAVFVEPNNGLTVQYRTAFGGATTILNTLTTASLPLYLEIQRVGNTFQAATSTDGINFTLIPGTTFRFVMPYAVMSGLAVSSDVSGSAGTAAIGNVAVSGINNTLSTQPTATACPSGWNCSDIGNPITVGDQNLTGGTWSLSGAGGDIWGNFDEFHYVWQNQPADLTLNTRVITEGNTNPNAKAGIMLRQNTMDREAAYYAAFMTPGNGVVVDYRADSGYPAVMATSYAATTSAYIQVARSGSTMTTYSSTDGTNWVPVAGSTVTIPTMSGTVFAGLAVTSHNTLQLNTSTFDSLNLTNSAPPPPTICPTGWSCNDIGFPTPAGDQILTNNVWTIQAGGGDIWGTSDSFRLVSQTQSSDGDLIVHISSQTNTSPFAKAGLMYRLTTDPGSPYYAIFVTPSHGVVVQYRSVQAGASTQIGASATSVVPLWVRIVRSGTTFTSYISSDGITWNLLGNSVVNVASLTGTLNEGMAVTSHNTLNDSTVSFDSLSFTPISHCPSSWNCSDVGSPAIPGGINVENNVTTIQGAGTDIYGTSDQFYYASQLVNDGDSVAHVASQSNTSPWAKTGIMYRLTADPGSPYYSLLITPSNGVIVEYRATQAGATSQIAASATTVVPQWLKVSRNGSTFTSYISTDGVNWTLLTNTVINVASLTGTLSEGLAVNSHNSGSLGASAFDSISFNSIAHCPAGWICNDIGSPAISGSINVSNNVYSVFGAGNDIWGTTDQFYYANQGLAGDGTIVARMTSQANTNAWAKAGIMMKQSNVALAPYVMIMASPANGLHMQYNFNGDQSMGAYTFPIWLKLQRTGDIFTAYFSSDGVNWTQGGTTTLVMPSSITYGLFVNSHNGGQLGNATFDNVTFNGATPTPTPTPTATPTPTPSPTPTPTPTPTATPTPSPTPTLTPTPTPTPTPGPVQLSNLVVADSGNASKWSLQTNLQVGNTQYGDRSYTFTAIPSTLVGTSWVKSANGSKTFIGNPLVSFNINQQATVYVVFDTRITLPSWVDGTWTNTGLTLTDSQAAGFNSYKIYSKVFSTGTVSLGPNDNGSTSVNMYTVIVK